MYKIFVGNIFLLKKFCRVDGLRKYFNTKILQHRSPEERTERVATMEKFFERNYIRDYNVHRKVCAGTVGEALVFTKTIPREYTNGVFI